MRVSLSKKRRRLICDGRERHRLGTEKRHLRRKRSRLASEANSSAMTNPQANHRVGGLFSVRSCSATATKLHIGVGLLQVSFRPRPTPGSGLLQAQASSWPRTPLGLLHQIQASFSRFRSPSSLALHRPSSRPRLPPGPCLLSKTSFRFRPPSLSTYRPTSPPRN